MHYYELGYLAHDADPELLGAAAPELILDDVEPSLNAITIGFACLSVDEEAGVLG